METQDRTDTAPANRRPGRPRKDKEQPTTEPMSYVLVEKPAPGYEADDQMPSMLAKGYEVDKSYRSRTHVRMMIPTRIRAEREAIAKRNRVRKMVAHASEHVNPGSERNMDLVRERNSEVRGPALSIAEIGGLVPQEEN